MRGVLPAVAVVLALSLLASGSVIVRAHETTAAPGSTVAAAEPLATDAVPVRALAAVGPLSADRVLTLTVTLASRDPNGWASFDRAVGTPGSGVYRDYLPYATVVERFGPSPGAIGAVRTYFDGFGASGWSRTPDGFGWSFHIPAAGAARALSVQFVQAPAGPGHGSYYTTLGAATLPASVRGLVAGLGGLSNAATLRTTYAPVAPLEPAHHGPGSFVVDGVSGLNENWFLGSDYTSAYRVSSLFPAALAVANASFPTGEAVATLLISGFNATANVDLPPFDPAVVSAYFNDSLPGSWPRPFVQGQPVTVGGTTPPPPGYFNGRTDDTADSYENCLDLEMAGSVAPGARLVNFYFAGSLVASPLGSPPDADVADYVAQTLAAALSYDYGPTHLAAVSASLAVSDLNDTLWNTELGIAQSMGVTVLAASGDQANAPDGISSRSSGQWPGWPATAAFDATGTVAVGGISPSLYGSPTSVFNGTDLNITFDASVTGLSDASAWYDTFAGSGNISGTEGGASAVYNEPSWQFRSAAQPAIVNATFQQGWTYLARAEPDVAFPANVTVVYVLNNATGIYFDVLEGTSVAAPVFAGFLASAASVVGHPFGFLDPELYRMASYYAAHPGDPTDPFLDVVQGGNYVFSASPGWDAVTGWGGLDALRFVAADANASVAGYVYTGPTPGLPNITVPPTPIVEISPWILVVVGLAVTGAVVLVISVGRTRRPPTPPYAPVPPGAAIGYAPGAPVPVGHGPPPPAGPATFACPYCGGPRPAEPVRCPYCGRY